MASGLKINNKIRLEILKYEYINLVQVMNRKGTDDKKTETYLEATNIFRDNKLKSILS
jgi:hypothetical protein